MVVFLAIIWAVFLISRVVPLSKFGLEPRSRDGLIGILTMPFLHADLKHILANSAPLAVLMFSLTLIRRYPLLTAGSVALLGGMLLWLFGRPGVHVGASGLVFGLAAFLVVAAWRDARPLTIVLALAVAAVYGSALLSGMLPFTVEQGVSWDGHLLGAVGGAAAAFFGSSPREPA